MGTYIFEGTADPVAVPSGYLALVGSGEARTSAGEWFSKTATQSTWLENVALNAPVISAKTKFGTMTSDSRGPCVFTLEGDGYCLLGNNANVRLYRYDNGVLAAQILPTVTRANVATEDLKIEFEPATGSFTALVNDVAVGTWTDPTYGDDLEWYGGGFSRSGRITTIVTEGAAAIVNINGDDTVVQGSAGNTVVTVGLEVATLSIGGIAVALTEVDPDNHTWDMPGFVDTEVYPLFDIVEAAVNTDEATKDVTLSLDPAYTATVMGTLSEADDCIATVAASEGLTIVATDTLYNTAGLTIYDDSTISDADDGTHIVWHRAAATNVMTQINLIISNGAIVTGRLTASALTARSLTSRSLTVRSL